MKIISGADNSDDLSVRIYYSSSTTPLRHINFEKEVFTAAPDALYSPLCNFVLFGWVSYNSNCVAYRNGITITQGKRHAFACKF